MDDERLHLLLLLAAIAGERLSELLLQGHPRVSLGHPRVSLGVKCGFCGTECLLVAVVPPLV